MFSCNTIPLSRARAADRENPTNVDKKDVKVTTVKNIDEAKNITRSTPDLRNKNNNNDGDGDVTVDVCEEDNQHKICIVTGEGKDRKRVCFVTGDVAPKEIAGNKLNVLEALNELDNADSNDNEKQSTSNTQNRRRRSTLANIGHNIATGTRKIPKKAWISLMVIKGLTVVTLLTYYYVNIALSAGDPRGSSEVANPEDLGIGS